ncbi:uncharacterized protein LOC111068955 isoform X1 [Drosophila obscura]|uniref:uncharacterized protein LOC111068955 isoform X1 n=1 Tax=Drosophila obscura TaxID=7282 RepID=UPI000BA0B9D6|nr:uncharacterized protein LOC111068955 isoform X1 [Drosophila obscura]XP_022214461.1 uncharacterized protein LOC111068955 isoform X1 [Drosophila obscura]XP_022214462.1 uncharacterized protein LOC111068955 isoform X1 [Drosophila obscura]
MRCQLMICAAIGLFLAFNINVNDAVIFKFTNIVCESYNQSWVVFRYCRLKAVGRDKVHLNINATILHPAYNITNHGKIFKRASGYKPWLLDTTVDACRFMRKNYDPFAKIVFSLFREFSNINHTCPYVGHQILKDFYLKPELLMLPFPTGDYLLSMRWYFGRRLQFDTNISFVFVEDLLKS